MTQSNRKRGLADVVTVEAWHKGFRAKVEKADLHVDVVFMSGRIGGLPGDDVRFQLSLKRAEVVVVLPPSEPAKVDPTSVSRDAPQKEIESRETKKIKRQAGIEAGIGVKANSNPSVGGKFKAVAGASAAHNKVVAIAETLGSITVIHSKTDDGDHRWSLSPSATDELEGRPWNSGSPRLKVIDTRTDRDKGLSPSVRVEVRCRREDLHITDIAMKDEGKWSLIKLGPDHRNKVAAAEALIRTRLFEEGLLSSNGDISDPYTHMTLAAISAESI
jgi:hypothetical protein